jgi:UDP-N-acetylmuramoyl-tripeptide--D-alanyl-D-alanine ligase
MAHAAQALAQRAPVFVAQEVAAMLPGCLLAGNSMATAARVHTDTRTIAPGDLFVALKGERFDANTLLAQAVAQGASIVVCHRDADVAALPDGVGCIHVDDTRVALQVLATTWRRKHAAVRLIGVTGSNGKTTVTQMIASVLRAHCATASLATQGNLNNDIGVPLTVLGLRAHHRMAVVEMGMNHPGEIAQLAAISQPDVVLVNNAQREHLEFMHTVEAVARENGSAIEFLKKDGVAVFPAADAFTPLWQSLAGARKVLPFGAAAVTGDVVGLESALWRESAWQVRASCGTQEMNLHLHIAGRHNVLNALAAAACALGAGVPITAVEQGLSAFEPVKGRSRALSIELDGVKRTLVDDTYNANPDSVRAAIDVLAELPGPRLLVLGDMGEVGDNGPQFHAEVAAYAQERAIEHVFLLGALALHGLATNPAARHFETAEELITAVLAQARSVDSILVKGSRFMRMERIVQALQDSADKTAGVGA